LPTPPPMPTAAVVSPVGPLWRWQGSTLSNGAQITVADPSRYTLQLRPDGSVAVKADCNQVSGTYTLSGTNLTITFGPSTLAACPPDSQADVYMQQLGSVVSYTYNNGALILNLRADAGNMRFLS
ncbi:MAG TPA: META domain-containing protein, partial [Roseiflexaceae bacterium]|nr:META domain-containing protein [Roseiflexaceae bacterium]